MICKACKNDIPDASVYCMFCGERVARAKKRKDEIKVPRPRQLPSGAWNIELRAEGQSVTEATAEKCIIRAKAIRAEFITTRERLPKLTLAQAVEAYIRSVDKVLSPSTVRGYRSIRGNRFSAYMQSDVSKIDFQGMVNEENTGDIAPKTVVNGWALVSKSLKFNKLPVPEVNLPDVPENELPWLNYKQILTFVDAIRGKDCEFGALLALHSLRSSELLKITPASIRDGRIIVRGAVVRGPNGNVEKETNKNKRSTRRPPIMIPRLEELIKSSGKANDEKYVDIAANTLRLHINGVCRAVGLPEVGLHGLRRSFASLAHHLGWDELETMRVGGWSNWQTVHKFYIKLDADKITADAERMRAFYSEAG